MTTKCFLIISASAALFSGCARNHVLFMTKSNVGLDFDSKPPTLEITVSRKEVVVGPAFEGGQMPPVAASFKPRVGSGSGFANFFLGVDQTFEGGDAALAMASLYSDPTPELKDRTNHNFNSALKLTEPPRYTGFMRKIPGPGETRTFIFGTDSSLGLKAAWSGAGGQFPDTVKLGFNRKEFAWAPLFLAAEVPAGGSKTNYSVKMPSFLATIQGRIETGGRDGGISALQYFASGETATLLALQKSVRDAMTTRMDPAAAALDPNITNQLDVENQNVERALDWLYGGDAKPKAGNLNAFLKGSKFESTPERFNDLTKDQLRTKLQREWHLEFVTKLSRNAPKNP